MATQVINPLHVFFDRAGMPLDAGYIYIGAANQNPQSVPVQVYWDEDLTIPAVQPIRTVSGYPSRAGTPAVVYLGVDDFSITVRDKNGALVFSALSVTSLSDLRQDLANDNDPAKGAALVGYAGDTVAAWIASLKTAAALVSYPGSGVVGDGVADDTVALQAVLDAGAGGTVVLTPGQTYLLGMFTPFGSTPNGQVNSYALTIPPATHVIGYGAKIVYDVSSSDRVHIMFALGSDVTVEGIEFINLTSGAPGERVVSMGTRVNHTLFDINAAYSGLTVRNNTFRNCFFACSADFRSYGTATLDGYFVHGNKVYPGATGNTGAIDTHAHLVDEDTSRVRNIQYLGNMVDGGTNASGLNLVGGHDFTITGNTVKNNSYGGIQTENGARNGSICGNSVINCTFGIWCDDSADVVVSANSVKAGALTTRGITVTREGFGLGDVETGPDYSGWRTDNVTVKSNTLRNCNIIYGTFGTLGGGVFGNIGVSNNDVLITNGASGPGQGITTPGCENVSIVGNKVIGAQTTSIVVAAGASQRTIISNNITAKFAAEASVALNLTASGERLITGNNFSNADGNDDPGQWSGTRQANFVNGISASDIFNGVSRIVGTGSPEGVVSAARGSHFIRTDGGAGTCFYVKETTAANTGWVAK